MTGWFMKNLKNIISFVIPLFIVLITYTSYSVISSIVDDYKQSIAKDYAIMIVTSTPLIKKDLDTLTSVEVKKVEVLGRDEILKKINKKLSQVSLEFLSTKLPHFYKVYFSTYPTISQLEKIKTELKNAPFIKRVETFSSNHNKIYSLLKLYEHSIGILFVFFILFAILLLQKQIKIWFLEHSKRISIIDYHGGSIVYSALPIIKVALISSLISSVLAIVVAFFITNNLSMIISEDIISMIPNLGKLSVDFVQITLISFFISILSIIGVILKYKIK